MSRAFKYTVFLLLLVGLTALSTIQYLHLESNKEFINVMQGRSNHHVKVVGVLIDRIRERDLYIDYLETLVYNRPKQSDSERPYSHFFFPGD